MKSAYDIVIIGSGAGGGTAAEYLSRFKDKGVSILLLDSGSYRTKEFFNQKEKDMTSMYYKRGGFLSKNLSVGVAAANTVGGSTAVYTGVSFRPPSSVLKEWRDDFGLSFLTDDYANSRLNEIEEQINVHELPESWDNENNSLFKKGADALGIPTKRLKINVKGCQQQGFCNIGCTSGGKQSTLEVQVPKALNNGIDFIYNAEVSYLEENKVNFKVKPAVLNTEPNKVSEGDYSISAKVIVLAAGVLNSPAILMRSLKHLNLQKDALGRYVTLHPALNVNGVQPEKIKNYRGFPKTYYIDAFSESNGYYLETSFYYPGITAKNNPGFGADHQKVMKDYNKMMSILILTHDKAEKHNRITVDKNGNPVLEYTVNPAVKASLVDALKKSVQLFFAAGCEYAVIPGSTKALLYPSDLDNLDELITDKSLSFAKSPLSSAHPQGGLRMSADETGAVDINGKLKGSKSIYVADACLFPTSVHVNPYETVMLLARYVSEQILSENFN